MPLIKYYETTTCYDGRKAFAWPKPQEAEEKAGGQRRHFYPDEYLIVNILQQMIGAKPEAGGQGGKRQVELVWEPWSGWGPGLHASGQARKHPVIPPGGDDGFQNSAGINAAILRRIDDALAAVDRGEGPSLIMAPFLYGYHHPGIVINVNPKDKRAIYIDPLGQAPSARGYMTANELLEQLRAKGFTVEVVTTAQQQDSSSCGPILTASMIKLMEEFLSRGKISTKGFQSPRPNLATDRVFQIYLNNRAWTAPKRPTSAPLLLENPLTDEIMLADLDLWAAFLQEQAIGLNPTLKERLFDVVKQQKAFIAALKPDWEKDPLAKKQVELICQFQSLAIELVFLKRLPQEGSDLIATFNAVFSGEEEKAHELVQLPLQKDLLSKRWLSATHAVLGIKEEDFAEEEVEAKVAVPDAARPGLELVVDVQSGEEVKAKPAAAPDLIRSSLEPIAAAQSRQSLFLRHPYLWGAIKWLAIAAVAATILYFSGGLAALPFLGELGAAAIPVVVPVLAIIKAALWTWAIKPLLRRVGFFPSPASTLVRNSTAVEALPGMRKLAAEVKAGEAIAAEAKLAEAIAGEAIAAEAKATEAKATEAKAAEASWYSSDQIEQLLYAPSEPGRPARGLKYVFLQNESRAAKYNFPAQLQQLRLLKTQLKAPFACFITFDPASFSTSHFVVGLLIKGHLVMINPTGESLRGDYSKQVRSAKGRNDQLLISNTKIQQDPNAVVNCGPICVELVRHLSTLTEQKILSELRRLLKTPKVYTWTDEAKEEQQLQYESINLANSSLLSPSLQALSEQDPASAAYPQAYPRLMGGLREQHQRTLALSRTASSTDYDERTLMNQLLLGEVTPLAVAREASFKRLQARFASLSPSPRSGGAGSSRHFARPPARISTGNGPKADTERRERRLPRS